MADVQHTMGGLSVEEHVSTMWDFLMELISTISSTSLDEFFLIVLTVWPAWYLMGALGRQLVGSAPCSRRSIPVPSVAGAHC